MSSTRRQVVAIARAVLGQRACERGPLLIEAVLELLVIELDERLVGLHGVAEVGEHAADDALDLRRNRDLVFGGERAHDFERAVNGLLACTASTLTASAAIAATCLRRALRLVAGRLSRWRRPPHGRYEEDRNTTHKKMVWPMLMMW